MSKLKLFALDAEDLEVISAHLQDAVVRIADLRWLPDEQRFVIVVNRFDRSEPGKAGTYRRARTALHFERVQSVRRRAIRQDRADAVLNLLAVRFEETDAPAGTVELIFSAGGVIRLDVECLEARLSDLGPVWSTSSVPDHETGAAAAAAGETGPAAREGA
ncbi:DUF2948 family protein [Microbaculum marinum]|uniref:DUF2948 family protein n=1 Tax=Microbaculum marinum TaxID=1764581 RepID=A0AAW9RK31_9HYPH